MESTVHPEAPIADPFASRIHEYHAGLQDLHGFDGKAEFHSTECRFVEMPSTASTTAIDGGVNHTINKKEAQKIRNRISAQKHRDRQKQLIEELQSQNRVLCEQNEVLQKENFALKTELGNLSQAHEFLRAKMEELNLTQTVHTSLPNPTEHQPIVQQLPTTWDPVPYSDAFVQQATAHSIQTETQPPSSHGGDDRQPPPVDHAFGESFVFCPTPQHYASEGDTTPPELNNRAVFRTRGAPAMAAWRVMVGISCVLSLAMFATEVSREPSGDATVCVLVRTAT
eukprot:Selendium_serpulae@DN5432_c0_g1_i4.p1